MGPNPDAPRPCLPCRERHVKCEWSTGEGPKAGGHQPPSAICMRCAKTGEQCLRTKVRFKHSTDLPIALDQPWVRYPARLHFVNETEEIKAHYSSEDGCVGAQDEWQEPTSPTDTRTRPRDVSASGPCPATPATCSSTPSPQKTLDKARSLSLPPPSSVLQLASSCRSGEAVAFPLTQPLELRLMQYYLEYMCKWFDLCDHRRHFGVDLPRRAVTSPILLNAIFALSARHLSLNEQFDPYAADRYHQECLQQLGGVPHDASSLKNDDLLAATILLRTLEEIDVKLIGIDHGGHLLGIQAFINSHGSNGSSSTASSLRQASFWIGLRQEIVVAFANQRSINISLDLNFIDRSFTPAEDDTWANRIILHCAEVVQFCFGDSIHPVGRYQQLKEYDEQWLQSRPPSFLPLAYSEPDQSQGEIFPHILYLNHHIVISLVHSIFARILLMCYNPTIPRIGAGHRLAKRQTEDDIRTQVRELCGTALSNRATIPAMFTASMGIAAAGDRFEDDHERRALLDVLVKTEVEHSWPTGASQVHLKRAWEWEDDA